MDSIKDISPDASVEIITFDSPEGKEIYRHSTSHIMAHAVKELFPAAKPAIGPAIEDGFYYDFDMDSPFMPEDLAVIEKKMSEIIKKNNLFVRKNLSKKDAIDLFRKMGEAYKVELISDIADEEMSIYEEGGFVDLCRGPHVFSTGA
ncbi:MAG: threonine--tRNA ligase, partial [Candidatus Omnitrophota bacterium]|nr:threonine--tRNA ligase [Candidatus Omnitrophota bacterium]